MSNPGVIELSNINLFIGNFRIEDNLGESIHLHIGDYRIDITIENLHELANNCKLILDSFIAVEGFRCKNFDSTFLMEIAGFLPDLKSVSYNTIRLSEMLIDTNNLIGLPVFRKIKYSRVVKALKGNSKEDDIHKQENDYLQSNHQRTMEVYDSIKRSGYINSEKAIVFFNSQPIIRDGQHRAAIMWYMYQDRELPIIRLQFDKNKYSLFRYPWIPFLFRWNRKKIKKVIKHMLKMALRIHYKVCKKLFFLRHRKKLKFIEKETGDT